MTRGFTLEDLKVILNKDHYDSDDPELEITVGDAIVSIPASGAFIQDGEQGFPVLCIKLPSVDHKLSKGVRIKDQFEKLWEAFKTDLAGIQVDLEELRFNPGYFDHDVPLNETGPLEAQLTEVQRSTSKAMARLHLIQHLQALMRDKWPSAEVKEMMRKDGEEYEV